MVIGHQEFFVRDPEAARQFYVDVLGFELVTVQGSDFVWVKLGNQEILLRRGTPPVSAANYGTASSALVLYVQDVAATVAQLEARGLVFDGNDGSPDCPTFRDPDGHWFQVACPS